MELKPWFLNCRPARRLDWEELEQRVIVLRPRFGESRWGRRLAAWLGLSEYRIRLDEIGSYIWHHCDGRTPAARLVQQLREEFGERVEPAEQRLQHFILQMRRARMINLEPSENMDCADHTDYGEQTERRNLGEA
jgi:hypothetical protein